MRSIATLALLTMLSAAAAEQGSGHAETVLINCFGPVTFLRFSPDGRELERACGVAFQGPKVVALFDTRNYTKAREFPVGLRMAAYSPDGARIATAETEDGARLWDATLPGKRWYPRSSRPSPLPGYPAEIYLLDPLRVLEPPNREPGKHVLFVEFSPDGRHLAATLRDGHVKVWATSSWNLEADLTSAQSAVHAAAFSPDSQYLVIGDVDGVLREWSLASKTEVKTLRTGRGPIAGIAFAPDGKTLVTAHQTSGTRQSGKREPPTSSATGDAVLIWNVETWTAVAKQGFGSAAVNGTLLALGSDHIELLDSRSLKEIDTVSLRPATLAERNGAAPKQPIAMSIVALAFSPDGGTLAAGCNDGTVHLVKIAVE
jgi:dipeptidyl aminopeptidase/acylaminoacyl peptidase